MSALARRRDARAPARRRRVAGLGDRYEVIGASRPRRHGRRLRRPRSHARSRGRHQGARRASPTRRGRAAAGRSADPGAARASRHRPRARRRHARRRSRVLRDEARARCAARSGARRATPRSSSGSICSCASATPCRSRTRRASCIAISSPRTSCSGGSAKCWSWTGALPRILGSAAGREGDRRHARLHAAGAGERAVGNRATSAPTCYALGALLEAMLPAPLPRPLAAIAAQGAGRRDRGDRYRRSRRSRRDIARFRHGEPVEAYRENRLRTLARVSTTDTACRFCSCWRTW